MADHIDDFNENDFLAEFGEVPNLPVSSMFEGADQLTGAGDGNAFEPLGSQAAGFGQESGQAEAWPAKPDEGTEQPPAGLYAGLNKLSEDFSPEAVESFPPMVTSAQMIANQIQDQMEEVEVDETPPDQDRERRLVESMRIAASYKTTSEAGRILWESARRDLTPDELARAPEFFKQPSLSPKDVAQLAHRYPSVSMLMQEPWVMATFGTRQEAKELGVIEKAFDTLGRTVTRSRESTETILIRDEIDKLYGKELVYGPNAEWTAQQNYLKQELEKRPESRAIALSDEQRRKVGKAVGDTETFWQRMWGRPAMASLLGEDIFLPTKTEVEAVADLANAGIEGGLPEVGARASEVVAGMVHSAIQPETLALIGGGAVVGSAVPAIGTAYGAGTGAMTGIATINYYKGLGRGTREALERGVPEDWARVAGVLTGLMNAFTDTAQVGIAVAPVKGGAKAAGKGLFTTYAVDLVERMAKETGMEMAQESLEMVSQDFATLMSNQFAGTDLDFNSFQDYVERNWETFKFMALGGTMVAGAGHVVSLPGDVMAHRRTRQAEAAMMTAANQSIESLTKDVATAAHNSEAMRTAPDAAGAIIERIARDQDAPQSFFVDAAALMEMAERNGLDAEALHDGFLEPMGASLDQLREAAADGTSLQLDIKGIPAVVDSPVWRALEESQGIIRAEPAKVTEERSREIAADDQAVNEAAARQRADVATRALRSRVKEAVEQSRAPEAAPEAAGAALAGFEGQTAYVEAETLYSLYQTVRELDPTEVESAAVNVLESLGLTEEALTEALQAGEDVALDLSGLAQIADSPIWEGLAEAITAEPRMTAETQADLEALGPPKVILSRADENVKAATRAGLEKRLREAGRTKAQAGREATVWSRMAGTLARITGADVNAIIDRVMFAKEKAGEAAATESLNQAAHLPADDSRVVFRSGMRELPGVEPISLKAAPEPVSYAQARVTAQQFAQQMVDNMDLGETIRITSSGIKETLHHRPSQADLRAFEVLPEMLAEAQWVRKDPNARESGRVSEVVFLYAPVEVDGEIHAAQITVKRGESGELHYYGHSLKKAEGNPATWSGETASGDTASGSAMSSPLSIKIVDLVENVKNKGTRLPEDMSSLYQEGPETSPRGRTDFLADGGYRVIFTEAADASTAVHEFEHIFMAEARKVLDLSPDQIADPEAHAQLAADINALEEWAGVRDGQWTVEAHEKVAQAFEQYFMEGQAPVKGLRGLFSRMKTYLLKIYESLVASGDPLIEISDDVRRVFDRQLATEEELLANSFRSEPMFDQAEFAREVSPEVWSEYEAAVAKGREAAREEITKLRNAEREKMARQWKREGLMAARNDPRQQRLVDIARAGGISRESMVASGYEKIIPEIVQKRPGSKLVSDQSQLGFDVMGERFGFEIGDDFLNDLRATPSIKELADAYVAEQEGYFRQYFDSESIITDAEIDLYEMELNLWARYMGDRGSKYQPRSAKELKRIIEEKNGLKSADQIQKEDMADLKASLKAQARAAKAGHREGRAVGREEGQVKGYKHGAVEGYGVGREVGREEGYQKGFQKGANEGFNIATALERADALQKRLELALKFKYRAERQRDLARTEAQWKRLASQNPAQQYRHGGILPSFHAQIKNIIHQASGIGRQVQAEVGLADFVARQIDEGAPIEIADWIVNGEWPVHESGRQAGRPMTYRQMPEAMYKDVRDAVTNLTTLGRRQQNIRVDGQLREMDAVINDLREGIAAHHEIKAPRTQKEVFESAGQAKGGLGRAFIDLLAGGYLPSLLKVETIARVLDGGQTDGIVQKVFYDPVNKAYWEADRLGDSITTELKDIVASTVGEKYFKDMRGHKETTPGVPMIFTREQRLMAILNYGNEQNRRALGGYRLNEDGTILTEAQLQAWVKAAPKAEWDLAQKLWDFNDYFMFPKLNALTLKDTGLPLKKVEASPIDTPYGQYRGGYHTLVFDREMSETAGRLSALEDAKQAAGSVAGGHYAKRTTNARSTRERVGKTYKDLLPLLNFDVFTRNLLEQVQDLTHREAVNDINRLLRDQRVRQAIGGAMGERNLAQFDYWVQGLAGRELVGDKYTAHWLKAIRRNITTASMAFKFSVALCQPSGIFQGMHKLGPKWTAVGLGNYFGSLKDGWSRFKAVTDGLYEKSPELAGRNRGGYDRDIHDSAAMRNPLYESIRDKVDIHGFKLIATLDQLTANSIWMGAYLKAQKEGRAEADSVKYADTITRITQPTGHSKDLSRMQRGLGYGDAGKLLTMFGTFFSGSHNLFWEQYHLAKMDVKKGEYGKAALGAGSATLFMAILPAVYDALMRDGMPDDEDDLKRMGAGVVSYFTGGMPVIKDAVSYAIGESFDFQPAPIQRGIADVINIKGGLSDLAEDNQWRGAARLTRAAGVMWGVPSGQITTTMKGAEEWDDREGFDAFYRLLVRESPK